MNIVLGIDNGTQSTKVLFYDSDGRTVVASAAAEHQLISKEDGTREQKAQWWIAALISCMDQVDPIIRSQVKAVGVSGQQHGFVPIDEKGVPLYSVKLWCDTSTADECDIITADFGGREKLLAETGNLIAPGFTASKILWLKTCKPELYARMRWVLLPHDYLNYWLTGVAAMEYGDASGTGLLDVRSRTWHKKLIQTIDKELYSKIPNLIMPGTVLGGVSEQAAKQIGLPAGIPVSCGGGDNMMGAIGTGTVSDGRITMSMGTSGTLYGCSSKPVIDQNGILAAFCSSTNSWLPLLCTMNCTVATELTRKLFDLTVKEIDKAGSKAPIGAEGVCMLPFFNGERVPDLPHGQGSIMGLNSSNYSRENIARASLESAVFGLRIGLDRFRELGFNVSEIRLIGGGAKSFLWRQMASDVLEMPIRIPLQSESAAFGAALQAFWMQSGGGEQKLYAVIDEHVVLDDSASCDPVTANVKQYKAVYAHYNSWVKYVTPMYKNHESKEWS
ncbi:MAG: xylulokinase [Spirochaeta sp. LUC14_002_19_P3]|nr:MAG: xylulokinase [Spirochaeta sp. LUC14_002_19_P3]